MSRLRISLLCLAIAISANTIFAGFKCEVEIRMYPGGGGGHGYNASLENFRKTNDLLGRLFRNEVGMNSACYVAPEGTGFSVIWIAVDNPELTPEIRAKAEAIISREILGVLGIGAKGGVHPDSSSAIAN